MRFIWLLLLGLTLCAETRNVNWLTPASAGVEVNGLPWYGENDGELYRFPKRLKEVLPKSVWGLSQSPSGGRIRFRTDANELAIRLEYPSAPNMANMHAFGQTGVDLYLDGVYRGTAIATKESKPGEVVEHVYFNYGAGPRVEREVALYLPLYKGVKVLGIGLDKEARVRPPRRFALAKPVVYYGTSITQGGCASRSGMSYQAIAGRMLNIDFVNLGFSGSGKGEPEVARAVAELDPAAFVLDFAQNNRTEEALRAVYDGFIGTLREKHPQTPIVCITPIGSAGERPESTGNQLEPMRELIRKVASQRIAAGDKNIQIIEGTDLIGANRLDGFVDGTHPNDLGFHWMAEGIAARLAKLFALPVPSR